MLNTHILIPWKAPRNKFYPLLRVDSFFPWEFSPLQSRKEKRLPFCVLGSFPLGLFPSASPASEKLPSCWGMCWSSPVLHTDTSGQPFPPKSLFFLGLKPNIEPSSPFPWQLNARCLSRVNSSTLIADFIYILWYYFQGNVWNIRNSSNWGCNTRAK